MFSKNQMEMITGQQIALTNSMLNRIDLWGSMLKGQAPWIDKHRGIVSLHLESAVCKELANVSLSEMETSLPDKDLNEIYQKAVHSTTMNEEFQTALGLGCFAMKPLGNTGKFEFIPADRIVPLEYDSEKKLRRAAFVQVKRVDDTTVLYRIELHELVNGGAGNTVLHIANRAFRGTDGDIGRPIPLADVPEWANLLDDVTYPIDRLDFGYYRNPIPNRVDESATPVSIFEDAIDMIERADRQYGRIDWEYESGERAEFVDYTVIEKRKQGSGFSWHAPEGKERMFVGMDIDDNKQPIIDHSPALRDANYIAGLNEYKRQIEFACGLAYGDLSKNENVDKTATEIRASKQRKYNLVTQIQNNLETCLIDFAYAMAFYMAKYSDDIGFECNFHDSILTDEETERSQDLQMVAAGLMSKLEFRMKWFSEDEKTARAALAEVQGERPEEPLS